MEAVEVGIEIVDRHRRGEPDGVVLFVRKRRHCEGARREHRGGKTKYVSRAPHFQLIS
jgi:hypothetical protein